MEHSFDIVLKKFGGSSLATPEKLAQVAQFIKANLKPTNRVCVVVSAMGQATNQLIALANQINPHPPKRELDMLISCGERSSMALLAMALANIGVKAISLTGSQSGIITDENHSSAEIIAIRPQRVLEALADYQVVIIAGFQGVSRQREITTLKRGGSDTTAVAMAAALKASACEIYSDVAGVMDADPSILNYAQKIDELDHELMCAMSLYGAKVVAHDAAVIAEQLGVSLLVAQSDSESGSQVMAEVIIKTKPALVKALTHLRGVIKLRLDMLSPNESDILCGSLIDGHLVAYISNDIAQKFVRPLELSGGLAMICLHLGSASDGLKVLGLASELLGVKNLIDIIFAHKIIFLIIKDSYLNEALNNLHKALL